MTLYLLDVNTLVALLYAEHVHARGALAWLDRVDAPRSVGVCRVVEMGALRLMTRRAVMGAGLLTPAELWDGWESALKDDRLARVPEPPGLLARWRGLCEALTAGSCADTDVYLAAFAMAGGYSLVTFDRGFGRFPELVVEALP